MSHREGVGHCTYTLFSRFEATQLEHLSVDRSVRRSVGPSVSNAFASRPARSDLCRVYGLVFIRTIFFEPPLSVLNPLPGGGGSLIMS